MDAHEKAQTLHRNVSLPNIILHRPEQGARRAGYLIDWELGVVPRNRAPYDHVLAVCPIVLCPTVKVLIYLKGTPAFMSIEALDMLGHVHGFEDDLESFIYVVLYAALRWLPVESPHSLRWRFTTFFGAPDPEGCGGGADAKQNNAISHKYTRSLKTTRSSQVLQWVNDAVDLHYKGWHLNPVWVDAKALKRM